MSHTHRLSDFKHICDKIRLFWGHPEFFQFVEELLFDTRGGRQGFPTTVMQELQLLYDIHMELVPHPNTKKDMWATTHLR